MRRLARLNFGALKPGTDEFYATERPLYVSNTTGAYLLSMALRGAGTPCYMLDADGMIQSEDTFSRVLHFVPMAAMKVVIEMFQEPDGFWEYADGGVFEWL